MTGVLPLQAGNSAFQTMFSPVARLHVIGRFFESLTPLPLGPRHCGQFSLAAAEKTKAKMNSAAKTTACRGQAGFTKRSFVTRRQINKAPSGWAHHHL